MMKGIIYRALLVASIAFLGISCGKDDEYQIPIDSPQGQINAVIDALSGSSDYSTFVQKLKRLDINEMKLPKNAFTVFVIRNKDIPQNALTEDNIRWHVVKGYYEMKDLTAGKTLLTVGGQVLTVTKQDDKTYIEDVLIESTGNIVSQSIVYNISSLIHQ